MTDREAFCPSLVSVSLLSFISLKLQILPNKKPPTIDPPDPRNIANKHGHKGFESADDSLSPLSLNPPTSPHVPWTSTALSESHGTPQTATTSSHRGQGSTSKNSKYPCCTTLLSLFSVTLAQHLKGILQSLSYSPKIIYYLNS